jgi:hypothetical protein
LIEIYLSGGVDMIRNVLLLAAIGWVSSGCAVDESYAGGDVCREVINGSERICSGDIKVISKHHAVKRGNVYWYWETADRESPCGMGPGMILSNITNLECLRSERNESRVVKRYHLDYMARYSNNFAPLDPGQTLESDWQKEQLRYYATDKKSVYWKKTKLEGADPTDLSIVFPFGKEEEWRHYFVAVSGGQTFLRGFPSGRVDWSHFKLLEPVRCPGHGLTACTPERKVTDFAKYGNWGGFPGIDGNDVIFIRQTDITRYPGLASDDVFVFALQNKMYLYSRGKFYEFADRGALLIDMDREYFEKEGHYN